MDAQFVDDVCTTFEARRDFCRFLASVFLYELTDEQIEAFAHIDYEQDGSVLAQGYATIVEYLRHRNRATRQELAVDYAHTFLGAGNYTKIMAPPYESVFTSKHRLLMQGARDGVLAYYRSEGLTLGSENATPEDHLGFELQFYAELIDRSTEALRKGDESRFAELIGKQRSFFAFHQENWLTEYSDAIDESCETDFYHGVADLLRGYVQLERDILPEVTNAFELEGPVEEIRSPWMDLDDEEDFEGIEGIGAYGYVPGNASDSVNVRDETSTNVCAACGEKG